MSINLCINLWTVMATVGLAAAFTSALLALYLIAIETANAVNGVRRRVRERDKDGR
jgi:hypothetical protein